MHKPVCTTLARCRQPPKYSSPGAHRIGCGVDKGLRGNSAVCHRYNSRTMQSGRQCSRDCARQVDVIVAPTKNSCTEQLACCQQQQSAPVAHLVVPVGLQRKGLRQLHARLGGGDDAELVDALLVAVVAHLQAAAGMLKGSPCRRAGMPAGWLGGPEGAARMCDRRETLQQGDCRWQRTLRASCISFVADASSMDGSLSSWSRNSGRAK